MPRSAIVLLVGLLAVVPAQAEPRTVWMCGLSADAMRLVCVADADVQDVQAPAERPVAVVNGTRFPLDTRQLYTVELLTQATEMAFVEQLARATMCYRTPACSVTFAPSRSELALAAPR